jgi:hypothetical protein
MATLLLILYYLMTDQIMTEPPPVRLTADNVHRIMLACSFNDMERWPAQIRVIGVLNSFVLHPHRLATFRDTIRDMLRDLPPPFHSGEGWSFSYAYLRADGERWAREPETIDQLCALGLSIGAVSFSSERETWNSLPGRLPYIIVNL